MGLSLSIPLFYIHFNSDAKYALPSGQINSRINKTVQTEDFMGKVELKKILVVDDDPTIIKLLEGLLKQNGYDVSTATDGLDAMAQVKKATPDLIILDIMMPEINGYEVCSHLKFDDRYKDIPIIIFTARDQELDPRVSRMMGIEYMQKPLNRDFLMSTIEKILK
jgi:DNA-binding response OmpR family regulator